MARLFPSLSGLWLKIVTGDFRHRKANRSRNRKQSLRLQCTQVRDFRRETRVEKTWGRAPGSTLPTCTWFSGATFSHVFFLVCLPNPQFRICLDCFAAKVALKNVKSSPKVKQTWDQAIHLIWNALLLSAKFLASLNRYFAKPMFCNLVAFTTGITKTSETIQTATNKVVECWVSGYLGSMFHLELGVDFDRGFSSGFSRPNYFRPFSVFGEAHKVPKSVTKSFLFPTKHKTTNPPQNPSQNPFLLAEKSIAKSVTVTRKIRRISTQLRCAP